LLCRASSWLTRTLKSVGFWLRRVTGASLHRRSGAGSRPNYQGTFTPTLAGFTP
jgi:hypothetical protein